jgi:low temperature requirement protein LtrA
MPALRTRMTARDTTEAHRASSPLELLFDLTFVVAIAQIAAQLAESAESGHIGAGLAPYFMVFFAIWWAWMNFTWFASAYDTDDALYRITTLVQMGGVLVLAAGVPAATHDGDYTGVTVGYLVMRIGLVAQWVRAGVQHPAGRATAFRYAIGITVVHALWVSRLALPESAQFWVFFPLAVLDLAVPPWAERTGSTAWHPHHIAERYGLFVIILLGESVLAATTAVENALAGEGAVTPELVGIATSGLVLLFSLWWLYFSEPAGEGLAARRGASFFWGYGHYFVFAALAAIGAGLEVAVASTSAEHGEAHGGEHLSGIAVGFGVAVPVALFLLLIWLLHRPLVDRVVIHPAATVAAVVLVLAIPLAADVIGVLGVLVGVAIVVAALVASTYSRR